MSVKGSPPEHLPLAPVLPWRVDVEQENLLARIEELDPAIGKMARMAVENESMRRSLIQTQGEVSDLRRELLHAKEEGR